MAQADVLEVLKKLEAHYAGFDLREEVIDDYVATFSATPGDVLEDARLFHVQTSRFFPKVSELRQIVRELIERQQEQRTREDSAAFWTEERRELWARIVEHSLTCIDFDFDQYPNVESCLACAPRHLADCTREQQPLGRHGARLVEQAADAGVSDISSKRRAKGRRASE